MSATDTMNIVHGTTGVRAVVSDGIILTEREAWLAVAVLCLGVLLLIRARARSKLAYLEQCERDRGLDFLGGVAIAFFVLSYLGLFSFFEGGKAFSGAELFVLLTGIGLGMISRPRMEQGLFEALDHSWVRARRLYLWTILFALGVFALSFVPWIDTHAVTTYTGAGKVSSVHDCRRHHRRHAPDPRDLGERPTPVRRQIDAQERGRTNFGPAPFFGAMGPNSAVV